MGLVHTNRSLKSLRQKGSITKAKDCVRLENIETLIEIAELNPDYLSKFEI